KLNSSSVSTGSHSMSVPTSGMHAVPGMDEYQEYVRMGNEIKEALTQPRQEPSQQPREEAQVPPPAAAPKTPVKCPYCGATTVPDGKGCCEYCGSRIRS
ncbi:MAG: hypothetical protein J5449_01900, partial [Oscillospiraceae bacterium]|nr:hypothetical protein [Oscillospiraceae bacterium]